MDVKISQLTKTYPGGIQALRGVNLEIGTGTFGLLGSNGAGKTTTMRIITGFMPASSGTVLVDGLDIFRQSLEARRRIGYLPETPPLYIAMRVDAYLRFVATLHGLPRAKIEDALEHSLEVCGLTDMRHRICGQLSKGYRQRVARLIRDGIPPGLAVVMVGDDPASRLYAHNNRWKRARTEPADPARRLRHPFLWAGFADGQERQGHADAEKVDVVHAAEVASLELKCQPVMGLGPEEVAVGLRYPGANFLER